MELQLYCLVFTIIVKMASSIRCYKCEPEERFEGIKLCKNFDWSDNFIGECEHSNMCFKRVTSLQLGNGQTTVTIARGCAAQTMSGDQVKINGKWQIRNKIYNVYDEGCEEDPNNIDKISKTVNCYCRGDLCNSSNVHRMSDTLPYFIPIMYLHRYLNF